MGIISSAKDEPSKEQFQPIEIEEYWAEPENKAPIERHPGVSDRGTGHLLINI